MHGSHGDSRRRSLTFLSRKLTDLQSYLNACNSQVLSTEHHHEICHLQVHFISTLDLKMTFTSVFEVENKCAIGSDFFSFLKSLQHIANFMSFIFAWKNLNLLIPETRAQGLEEAQSWILCVSR